MRMKPSSRGIDTPLVYVVVLNWNGGADTLECLASVQRVTYPGCRVLLVDNGSTDDSVAQARRQYPGLAVLENGANLGFAAGNNAGIALALAQGADYVLLLNNDTVVDPGFLEPLLAVFADDPQVGFASAKIYYYDRPDTVWFFGGAVRWANGWAYHLHPNRQDAGATYQGTRRTPLVTGCCLLARRAVFEQVGLLDPRFFLIYEDADWSVRAGRAGYKGVVVGASHIWHKVSASFRRDQPAHGTFYFTRNGLLFIHKHAPRPRSAAWQFVLSWVVGPSLREARHGESYWGRRALLRLAGVLAHLARRYAAAPVLVEWLVRGTRRVNSEQ